MSNIIFFQSIPGKISSRDTMYGELIAIHHALSRCIAWNNLSPAKFAKYFNSNLHLSMLFGNFLLARYIMKALNCKVFSHPRLEMTDNDDMWQIWFNILRKLIEDLPEVRTNIKPFVPYQFFYKQMEKLNEKIVRPSLNLENLPIIQQSLVTISTRNQALQGLLRYSQYSKQNSLNVIAFFTLDF